MDFMGKIERSIKAYAQKDYELAMMMALIAIDEASRRYFSEQTSSRNCFIKFLKEYGWLIEPFGWIPSGAIQEKKDLKLENGYGKEMQHPCLADIIYTVYRCNMLHGEEIPIRFELMPLEALNISTDDDSIDAADRCLHVPYSIVFGLLAACVFNRGSAPIGYDGNFYLTYTPGEVEACEQVENDDHTEVKFLAKQGETAQFLIRDSLGKEDVIKAYLDSLGERNGFHNRFLFKKGQKVTFNRVLLVEK